MKLTQPRRPRLSVEVFPEEELLVRQVHAAAALQGITLREWVMAALREALERQERPGTS